MIKSTIFATSNNFTKPALSGVYFSFQQGQLTCIATNSHRLAFRQVEVISNFNGHCIVPKSSLVELLKLLKSNDSPVNILMEETYILFEAETFKLYSRLIDGSFPNINGIISKQAKTTVTLLASQLYQGVDRAYFFAKENKNNNVHLECSNSTLKIFSHSSELGEIKEVQSIQSFIGEDNGTIAVDGQYLLDSLKVLKDEEFIISFNGTMSPLLIHSTNNKKHLHLISPVRSS